MEADSALLEASQQSPVRILIADDSNVERSLLSRHLRTLGYQVEEAPGGEAAINCLKNHEVGAVLLDLNMPVVDGFDVLGYIQKHRRSLPVILLSGMPLDQIQHEIHSLPDHELPPLFLKPVDLDQLVQLLEMQLSGELPSLPPDSGDAPALQ